MNISRESIQVGRGGISGCIGRIPLRIRAVSMNSFWISQVILQGIGNLAHFLGLKQAHHFVGSN